MVADLTDVIAPLVTLGIGITSIYLIRNQQNSSKEQHEKQLEQNKKLHQVHGLLEAFRILDNEAHREDRKIVFNTYFIYYNLGNLEVFRHPQYRNAIANVMADFDIMGKLVNSG